MDALGNIHPTQSYPRSPVYSWVTPTYSYWGKPVSPYLAPAITGTSGTIWVSY